ncbi:hypothetical protein GOODEAATRI_032495, partial [Goodea atripinnis]
SGGLLCGERGRRLDRGADGHQSSTRCGGWSLVTSLTLASNEGIDGVVLAVTGAAADGVSVGGVRSLPSNISCNSSSVKSRMEETEILEFEEEPVEVATGLGRPKVEPMAQGSTGLVCKAPSSSELSLITSGMMSRSLTWPGVCVSLSKLSCDTVDWTAESTLLSSVYQPKSVRREELLNPLALCCGDPLPGIPHHGNPGQRQHRSEMSAHCQLVWKKKKDGVESVARDLFNISSKCRENSRVARKLRNFHQIVGIMRRPYCIEPMDTKVQ